MKILTEYGRSVDIMAYGKCLKKFVNIVNEIFGEEIKITQSKNFTAAKEVIEKMDAIFNVKKKYPNAEFIYNDESDDTAFIIGAQRVEIHISDDIKVSIKFTPFYKRGKPKSDIVIEILYSTESEINTDSDIESVFSKNYNCLNKKQKSILNKIINIIQNDDYFIDFSKYITIRP